MTVPVALPDVQNTKNGLISLSHGTVQNLSARLTGIHPASCSLYLHIGRKRPAVQSGLFRLALVRRTTSLAKRPPGGRRAFLVKAFQPSDASASEEGENCRLVRNASFQQGDACGREDLRKNSRRGVGLSAGLCFIIHRVQFRGRRGDGGMVDNGTAGAGADCAGQQKRNRLARLQGRPGKVAGPRLPAFSAVQ